MLPALELITTLATEEEGEDGDHSLHEEASTTRRYLRAARAHHMLLILDIQPGYASFIDEARRLEPFLKQPDVSLALDPEWSLTPPQLPCCMQDAQGRGGAEPVQQPWLQWPDVLDADTWSICVIGCVNCSRGWHPPHLS